MREFSEQEKKICRRLRQAFRRAVMIGIKKNLSPEEAKKAVGRVTTRAVRLGWLELPKKA